MRYRKLPAVRALLALIVLHGLSVTALGSSVTDEQLPLLTLQEAVARALADNPGIKVARLDVDIQQARRDAVAFGSPYALEAELENFAGTDDVSGFDGTETTLQLSKKLELGDKRKYRADLGDAQVGLARITSTVRELALAAEVSRRYAEVLKRQEQITLSAASVEIASRTLEIVSRRVAVGRASEAEQSSASVGLSRTELIGKRLAFELSGARVSLVSLWGDMEPGFSRVAGDIYSIPPLPAFADFQARLVESPELLRIGTEARIRNAERRLAQSRRRPDIELSAGVRHLAATDDAALVFSLNMPFGSGRRAEPLVREADTAIAKTPLTREERLLDLRATLYGFYQLLLASRDELLTLREQIIPEAERAVQFYERGFELGSYNLLELTSAQERLLALRGEALDAAASFHLTLIEIQSLLGSISPGGALQ